MNRSTLNSNEYNAHYYNYIKNIAPETSILDALKKGKQETRDFYSKIPKEKLKTSYAADKWTILEVVQHLIDNERIFAYRALCVARGDKTDFPGYEQDDYVPASYANKRNLEDLLAEHDAVRDASIYLFKSLDDTMLKQLGSASKSPLSPRAMAFVITGHERHHERIVKERYL